MDIGERLERGLEALKDIQWEIRENEARYRDLLDNQADVILRRDAQGHLTFVNQAFCRLFALERATVLGQIFSPRVMAGDMPAPRAVTRDMYHHIDGGTHVLTNGRVREFQSGHQHHHLDPPQRLVG